MTLFASDITPISDVALVDAKKFDDYHALALEHTGLVLLTWAEAALHQVLLVSACYRPR